MFNSMINFFGKKLEQKVGFRAKTNSMINFSGKKVEHEVEQLLKGRFLGREFVFHITGNPPSRDQKKAVPHT